MGYKTESSNLKKRDRNDTKDELQVLYAACKCLGLSLRSAAREGALLLE